MASTEEQHGSRPGVLFDVDGTLVDTNYLHTLAWSRAFAEVGEWAPMKAIHRHIGMGGDQLVPDVLGHDCPEAHEARERHYRELMGEAKVFPGARELLRRLHDDGLTVVLASSAPGSELEAMMDLLDAGDAIDATTSSSDADRSKPAPDIFQAAMRAGNVDRERALVVGDSVWDVQAARAAGLACVGVESGGFSVHELADAGALHTYRDVQEMLDQVRTSPLAVILPH
ncbi:MAG: HAD-superfamily hydrolase, subfamily variant 3 [Actinomycetia bacterium]|nr:HAD-superfamily hydrolase, subfamily variant 3 [Actinomycetes bacterium]